MGIYLARFGYTPETWAAMIENPQDRRDQLASRVFSLGGRLVGFWYSLGEHDGYALTEYPDETAHAAAHLAIEASGAFRYIESIPLLSVEDVVEALERAQKFAYATPGN